VFVFFQVYPVNNTEIFRNFPLVVANATEAYNPQDEKPTPEDWLSRKTVEVKQHDDLHKSSNTKKFEFK
jgi:hypothetical protein